MSRKYLAAWRNHGLPRDALTDPLLGEQGIQILSDQVSINTTAVGRISQELQSAPINTLPDLEHVLRDQYVSGRIHFAPLEGKSMTEEGMAGISGASSAHD